jgi:hypothetical protein
MADRRTESRSPDAAARREGERVERLLIAATRLWRTVLRCAVTDPVRARSLALVAERLARSLDDLRESIELVLVEDR